MYLHVDESKLTLEVRKYLKQSNITIFPYDAILNTISKLITKEGKIWIDLRTINYAIYQTIPNEILYEAESPIVPSKAVKNLIELAGMRACHLRDGAAVSEFLAFLTEKLQNPLSNDDSNYESIIGRKINETGISEYEIDLILTYLRKQFSLDMYLDNSFPTIAGCNSNGAIIHYRANKNECKMVTKNDMLLLDSGGQYLDGTTDVTRTFHLGTPTDRQVR